jgi:putative transposase
MRGPKPQAIEVSEAQQQELEAIVRRRNQAHGLIVRAKIVLAAARGEANETIARQLAVHREMVRHWRARWHVAQATLGAVKPEALREAIEGVLADEPRSGAPATFTAEQLCQLMAVACEEPEACGRPVTHWTPAELADEVIQRGIVNQISPRSVGRFLKRGRSQAASVTLLAE